MEKRKKLQRFLSMFLSCVLVLNVPVSVLASEELQIVEAAESAEMFAAQEEVSQTDANLFTDTEISNNEEAFSESFAETSQEPEAANLFGDGSQEWSEEADQVMVEFASDEQEVTDGRGVASTEGYVFLSVSHDGTYINSSEGEEIACLPVSLAELENIDLNDYGLGEYVYDANKDGINDLTALYLMVYAHENIYGGSWSEVEFNGAPGSGYFASGLFGFANDMNYYYNGLYPINPELTEVNGYATGATTERVVLNAGDYVDVAGFNNDTMCISHATFCYFTDENYQAVRTSNALEGEAWSAKLCTAGQDWTDGSTRYDVSSGTVYYSQTAFAADAASTNVEADGNVSVTFDAPGTWYLWCPGYNDGLVSCAPAYVTVEVEEAAPTVYTVTLPEEEGYQVVGETSVVEGADYTFTINISDAYDGSNMVVTVNGETINSTDGVYTVANVAENLVIAVSGVTEKNAVDPGIANGNVIDITDREVYKYSSSFAATATNLTVADSVRVISASEDGTTINVLLAEDTNPSAEIGFTFGYSKASPLKWSQNVSTCTLVNGCASVTATLTASITSSRSGSVDYTINFSMLIPEGVAAERVQESDTFETYASRELKVDLSVYFKYADTYYLVDGETKTELEDKMYSVRQNEEGEYTYTFAASNANGVSETVTITVNVIGIKSGVYIAKTTSNGSLDYVIFTDANGEMIDGISVFMEGNVIEVMLPKTYPLDGKVTATFSRTANSSDYPFVTNTTTFNQAFNARTDVYTNTLSAGAASRSVYLYNTKPGATSNNYETYTINYKIQNELPVLAEGQNSTDSATVSASEAFELNLKPVFYDEDNDELTYYVSVNGAEKVKVEDPEAYSFVTNAAGEYTLVFTANDKKADSVDTYTVTLTVENLKETYQMTVSLPEELTPVFYAGTDATGDSLEAVKEENSNAYVVSYPINAEKIFVSVDGWGGCVLTTVQDSSVVLRQVQVEVVDFAEKAVEAGISITYGDDAAVQGENGYILPVDTEYTYTAVPVNTSSYLTVSENAVLESGSDVYKVVLFAAYKDPKTITVPTGATAQMFAYNKYYDFTEIKAEASKENGDGTTTFYFITSKNNLSWRASCEGFVTEAGYWTGNLKVNFDNGANSPLDNATVEDNSVMLNVNGHNNLVLSEGSSYKLKGYRAWEIIKYSYQNEILTPDFHFDILSGENVVSLTPADSLSNGASGENSDWMTVKAENSGTAVIEVSYDALDVAGGSWPGLYKASDAERTGLVVVQVGGNDSSVNFGIDCYSGLGSTTYNESNAKAWDAEFDTLYFLDTYGTLNLTPSASSAITEVAVSHDKGASWIALTNSDGAYTAPIISGNNIIRVTTANGTAYQVVRGKQVSYTLNIINGNDNSQMEAGETVRLTLNGLHTPIPKMAGNYNPGYLGNTDGDSGVHLSYTWNGETVKGAMSQYVFAATGNYIDVTIPEDYTEGTLSLTEGYIGVGVMGLTSFVSGGDSHRNIPDGGCATRGDKTTFNTRSILPDIQITLGEEASPNTAPVVNAGAISEMSVKFGYKYPINPETMFTDPEGDAMTYTVSVNGGEPVPAAVDYKFNPEAAGEYTLVFYANDGEYEISHTIIVTVEKEEEPEEVLIFNIAPEDIVGYVTVGVEDKGIRVEGERGLTYPVALGTIVKDVKVPFAEGDSVADVTIRLFDAKGMGYTYTGTASSNFYLASIKNFVVDGTMYEEMGEFDAGAGSGWMITLNDWFIDKGASEFTVKDGDVVKWKYTCQLGSDIGDDYTAQAVEKVEAAIALIPSLENLTVEDKETVEAARAAFEALTAKQKELVSGDLLAFLNAAEAKLEEMSHTHSWDHVVVTKEATCKETGVKTYTCDCGESKTETIPKVSEHTYGEWITVSEATVSKAKVQKHTCSVCGKSETKNVGKALKPVLELPGNLKGFRIKNGATVTFAISMANGDKISSVVSSNAKYLKVSSVAKTAGKIKVKAVKAGTVKLTITLASGKTRTYTVKVVNETVKTSSLSVSNVTDQKLTLAKGKTFALQTVKVPFTSTQKITYTSSDKNVATVTSAGEVKATGVGQAVITAVSGSKKVAVTVTVPGITNVKSSVTVKQNKKLTLKPKTYGLSGKVTYASSDTSVAKVSSKGKITGVAPGKAVITVSCGGKKVKTTVTVPGIANVASSVTVKKNKTLTLKPELYGISGTATYTSSNKNVATVTSGGKIKGVKKGTAQITIKAGGYSKTVTVNVK